MSPETNGRQLHSKASGSGGSVDNEPDPVQVDQEERRALDLLFSATYEELRRLAASLKRSGPNVTLSPSTLVNEAWLKLSNYPLAFGSKMHFKCIAARAMRQVLVDAARRRDAQKRGGGGAAVFVTFDDAPSVGVSCDRDILALHDALDELALANPRQATLVEYRFFGGFEAEETGDLLGISRSTVDREWRAARAWLAVRIREKR